MRSAGHSRAVTLTPVSGIGAIRPGADLAAMIAVGLERARLAVARGDVLVVCQKAVSKAEGRVVSLAAVRPSDLARRIAERHRKDPRFIEVVLRETRRIVRMNDHVLVCETHHGFVCANAGVDSSNPLRRGTVTLLPVDPDRSAVALRAALGRRLGVEPAVIVTDTFGRPFREGQVDVAIGVAGMRAWRSLAGGTDWTGRALHASAPADADIVAAAAGLVVRKDAGEPVVHVRGFPYSRGVGSARQLVRAEAMDLFR